MASGYSYGAGGAITDWHVMDAMLSKSEGYATESILREKLGALAAKAAGHGDWPIGRDIKAWAEARLAELDALAVSS